MLLQCVILSILLALGLISGGISSALNAADVQEDYLDNSVCDQDNLPDRIQEICNQVTTISNSQAASAVINFQGLHNYKEYSHVLMVWGTV